VNISFQAGPDRLTVSALDSDDVLIGGLGQDDLDGGPDHNHLDSVIEPEGGRGHERYCRSRPGGRDEGYARDGRGHEKQK
jgi:hypothetical protein